MNAWILVWFIVAVLTTAAMLILGANLVRHVMILGRTARQMQDELQPIVDDLSREGARASRHASSLRPPTRGGRNPS